MSRWSRVKRGGRRVRGSKKALTAGSILGLPLLVNVGFGQQSTTPLSQNSNELQDIVVTAQRREQSLQDVPLSVTALQGSDLEARGATSFADYLRDVPGVSFVPVGPGLSQLNIRGVETQPVARDQPGVKPTVGMYLDDTPLSVAFFNPDLDIFDMQRVEVLRGPQGTLFGSGSLAGTVRFVTNKPKMDTWEAETDASYGSIHTGGTDYSVKGMINIPLIDGRMALRIVAYENQEGGYIDRVQIENGGQVYGLAGTNVNEVRKDGFRAELGITGDHFTAVFTGLYQSTNSGGYPLEDVITPPIPPCGGCSPNSVPITTGPDQQFRQEAEGHNEEISLFSANLNWDFNFANLTSASSFTSRHIADSRDYSLNDYYIAPAYAYPGSLIDHTELSVFSQELRLASQGTNKLDWLIGGFFSDQNRTYNQVLNIPGTAAEFGAQNLALGANAADQIYDADFTIPYTEYALFTEETYHFTPQWAVTAGLREYQYNESVTSAYKGFFGSGGGIAATTDSKANGANPRAILVYTPVKDLLFSAQAAKGFRLGSSNDRIPVQVCGQNSAPSQYGPEHIWNYELDAKSRFANGRVTLNAALYQINYSQIQLNARLECSFSFIENGSSAQTRGGEVELWLRPIDALTISFNGTVQNAKLTSDLPSTVAPLLPGVGNGSRLPGSPKQTYNVATDYTFPWAVGSFLGYLGATYQSVGGIKTYIQDPDSLDTHRYTLGTGRIGLHNDHLDLSLHIDNAWNERAQLSLERSSVGQYSYSVNPPRTIGAAVQYRF